MRISAPQYWRGHRNKSHSQVLPMNSTSWILIDTETTGLTAPIVAVELAAQRMLGWQAEGEPFRRVLNQNAEIPPEASRVHGYTREILERDGDPPAIVYRNFSLYVRDRPIVSYNLEYDLEEILWPEWQRLGIERIGTVGFCALRLAQRLLDPVPAGNCKLQTLRQYYRLPERAARYGARRCRISRRLDGERVAPHSGAARFEIVVGHLRLYERRMVSIAARLREI